jgi:hypothetical protein
VTEFITYATEYDLYTGRCSIGDLSTDDQDALIREIFSAETDFRETVVAKQIKKAQAEGLWSLVVLAGLALESSRRIKNFDQRTDADIQEIVGFFSGTQLWLRLEEAFPPFDIRQEKTKYDWTELEKPGVQKLMAHAAGERPHIVKQKMCDHLAGMPSQIGATFIDRMPYHSFKHYYDERKLILFVDRGLAPVAARARIVAVPWSTTLAMIFFLGLIAALPLWFFVGFWYAVAAFVAAVVAKRTTMRLLIKATRDVAIADTVAYKWLLAHRIIWFRYVPASSS